MIIGVIGAGCKARWQTTSRILDLWSIDLSRLEHVDGEGLPFDYHKHHMFLFPLVHVRSVGSQIAYSEDDNVNSVAPGTARPSSVKHRKAMEKHRKPSRTILENHGLPRRMQVFRTVCNHAAKLKGSSSCIRMLFVVILVYLSSFNMCLKHHAFLFPLVHVWSVACQTTYSEDDNVNSPALGTSSDVKGNEADQELQGHDPQIHVETM